MPQLRVELRHGQFVLPGIIRVPGSRPTIEGFAQNTSFPFRGLVDTGATHSVIDPSFVNQLRLTQVGSIGISTPSTGPVHVEMPIYDACLEIGEAGKARVFDNIPMIASDLSAMGVDVLIGMNLIVNFVLCLDGPSGVLTVQW